jgi:hypothetical protein
VACWFPQGPLVANLLKLLTEMHAVVRSQNDDGRIGEPRAIQLTYNRPYMRVCFGHACVVPVDLLHRTRCLAISPASPELRNLRRRRVGPARYEQSQRFIRQILQVVGFDVDREGARRRGAKKLRRAHDVRAVCRVQTN